MENIPKEVLQELKRQTLDSARLLLEKDGVEYYECYIEQDSEIPMPTGLPNICKFENGIVTWLSDRAALELLSKL